MTNSQIEKTFQGLNTLENKNWPARVAFAILRNIKTLQPLVEDIQQVRLKTLTEYGERNPEDASTFQIPPENVQKVQDEFDSLYNTEVEVTLVKIKLQDIENCSLSMEDMEALYEMVEED